MTKYYLSAFLIFVLSSCNNQGSLSGYGKMLFSSLKEHDLASFGKLSIMNNKQLQYEVDTLLGEPINAEHNEERRNNINKNFFETRQGLIEQGCIWDQAKYIGFNYNLQGTQAGFKMYTGELIFESNAKQFKVDAGRIIQKGNGVVYFLGSFPLTIRK